jgi:gliding motility-associated-like protein
VVNENGLCDTAYQITIIGGLPLVFDSIVLTDATCGNSSDGIIQVYITSGVPPLTYSLDNGISFQDSLTFNNLAGGSFQVLVQDSLNCGIDSTVTILQATPLVMSVTLVDSLSCFNTNDGQISLSTSGGTAPYEYAIDGVTFSANSIFSNLSDGIYVLYVRDTNQCIDSLSVTVFAPTALVLVKDSTNVTCNGLNNGNASVTVSGGTSPYTYLWNDSLAQATSTATGLAAGNYEVIVTDNRGCADTAQVAIIEPNPLLLVLDNLVDVLCNGAATGAINISTAGGTAPYSYLWTNAGGINEDLLGAVAGSYTLTVSDANACTFQITQVITQPTVINVGLVATNISCFGLATGAVNANISGGTTPYLYAWTGPNGFTANTEDISTLVAGSYTLITTDANNCSNTQTLSITQPATVLISITNLNVACFGDNTGSLTASVQSGGTAPFQFQWDAAANNQLGNTATGLIAGSYTVTVTDANTCAYTSSATITEPINALTVSATGTDISCASANDGTALATIQGGTPGYSYLWNDPQAQTSNPAVGLASNIYQVTVTDANGCNESDTTFIDAPNPIIVVSNPDSANCWGEATGAINVFAQGGTGLGYAYSIDGGESFQNSADFANLPAGVYNEIVVQDLGANSTCLSDIYTTTVFEQAYFSFEVMPEDTTLQLEESVTLALNVTSPFYDNSNIVLVSWLPTLGLNCSDCIDPTLLTYDSYTEYTATVSYEGGDGELCVALSNTIINVENNLELFIPNAFTPGSFDDMNNVFEVYGEGIEYVTMQVYNRWGEKIFESSNQRVAWDGIFKGEIQRPGVYTYYVNVEYLDGKALDRKGSVTLIR